MIKTSHYIIGFIVLAFLASMGIAYANPSFFPRFLTTGTGATATTTAQSNYMTFGVGTTTVYYDSTNPSSASIKADSALVVVQVLATSTISIPVLNARVEYALDTGVNCAVYPTRCDWYPQSNITTANATTSVRTGNFSENSFPIATTTFATDAGGSSFFSSATTSVMQSFSIDTPTRFTRVKFYVPSGGGKFAIWAAIQPVKEMHE